MTLDEAHDRFFIDPCYDTAVALIETASEYWVDDMIAENTFDAICKEVSPYIDDVLPNGNTIQ